jgi:uncharacterized protein YggL (DUF469 family)
MKKRLRKKLHKDEFTEYGLWVFVYIDKESEFETFLEKLSKEFHLTQRDYCLGVMKKIRPGKLIIEGFINLGRYDPEGLLVMKLGAFLDENHFEYRLSYLVDSWNEDHFWTKENHFINKCLADKELAKC